MPYPAYQWSILGITTISTINELSTKLFMIGINIASKINGELKYKMKKNICPQAYIYISKYRSSHHHTHNSHPNVSLSLVEITGRTRLSEGISETRENKNIAASKDWKNIRAPAKKKFPMLQKLWVSVK